MFYKDLKYQKAHDLESLNRICLDDSFSYSWQSNRKPLDHVKHKARSTFSVKLFCDNFHC